MSVLHPQMLRTTSRVTRPYRLVLGASDLRTSLHFLVLVCLLLTFPSRESRSSMPSAKVLGIRPTWTRPGLLAAAIMFTLSTRAKHIF